MDRNQLESKRKSLMSHLKMRPGLHLFELPNLLGLSDFYCKELINWMLSNGEIRIESYPENLDGYGRFKRIFPSDYPDSDRKPKPRPMPPIKLYQPGDPDYPAIPSSTSVMEEAKKIKPLSYGWSAIQPPNVAAIEKEIDRALASGDRPWAIAKLNHHWNQGWHDSIANLLQARKDWPFEIVSSNGKEAIHEKQSPSHSNPPIL